MPEDSIAPGDNSSNVKKPAKKSRKWHWSRQAVQILVFLLFLYLLFGTRQNSHTHLPSDFFFHLDPLAGITAMIAGRTWIIPMFVGGITLILTIAVGRAWCHWLCPMGTVLDWTPSRHPCRDKLDISPYWRLVKYFFLFAILIAALFGSLTLMILDPITLLFRTLASVVLPGLDFLITAVETGLYNIGPLQPAVAWFDSLLQGWLLTDQPFYLPNLLLALLFAGVLALNAIRPRFWCRYLCPLGGLLGLVSRFARVRHEVDPEKCVSCNRCALQCPTGAIDPEAKFAADSAECTTCLECMEICPTKAVSFHMQPGIATPQRYDPSRRDFLTTVGAGIVGATLLWMLPALRKAQPQFIRPPGTSEEQLLSRCIRCGICAKVCPTGVIQPNSSAEGWNGLWTPVLNMRLGYCDYSCTSCGQVCPTDAIPKLLLKQKQQTVIGTAVIDRQRCIPWAEGRECVVCEEVCPVPRKAVRSREQRVVNASGQTAIVRVPRTVPSACTGCGICEHLCPVNGVAAIRVYPVVINGEQD